MEAATSSLEVYLRVMQLDQKQLPNHSTFSASSKTFVVKLLYWKDQSLKTAKEPLFLKNLFIRESNITNLIDYRMSLINTMERF